MKTSYFGARKPPETKAKSIKPSLPVTVMRSRGRCHRSAKALFLTTVVETLSHWPNPSDCVKVLQISARILQRHGMHDHLDARGLYGAPSIKNPHCPRDAFDLLSRSSDTFYRFVDRGEKPDHSRRRYRIESTYSCSHTMLFVHHDFPFQSDKLGNQILRRSRRCLRFARLQDQAWIRTSTKAGSRPDDPVQRRESFQDMYEEMPCTALPPNLSTNERALHSTACW